MNKKFNSPINTLLTDLKGDEIEDPKSKTALKPKTAKPKQAASTKAPKEEQSDLDKIIIKPSPVKPKAEGKQQKSVRLQLLIYPVINEMLIKQRDETGVSINEQVNTILVRHFQNEERAKKRK